MKLRNFEDHAFFITGRVISQGASDVSVGTGFLVRQPLGVDNAVALLLITNKHVAIARDRHFTVTFNEADKTKDPDEPILGKVKQISGRLDQDLYYFEHPDKGVDLVAINMVVLEAHGIFYRLLDLDKFNADFDGEWLVAGKEVSFIGYPSGRYDIKNNLPIWRRGTIASIARTDFNGKKQFLIDAAVYQGSSGSPVFANSPDGKVKFLGVLTEVMARDQKLIAIPANFVAGIRENIGLGFVLKPELVQELVDHAVAQLKIDYLRRKSAAGDPVALEAEVVDEKTPELVP